MKKAMVGIVLAGVCAVAGCRQSSSDDAQWAAKRAAAVARPRPLVYNTDGCDMLYWPSNLPVSVENFTGVRLRYVPGTCISTVSYCPQSAGFGHFTCRKAGDPLVNTVPHPDGNRYNAASRFFALGTDAMEMASDWCRANGKEVFLSIRFNDTHDAAGSLQEPNPLFPAFKRNNPDCLMGRGRGKDERPPFCSWSAVDFAQEKVRAHMKRFMRDLVENYDVDGVEYDFNRHMQLFKTVAYGAEATQAELDLMTSFMRELKQITEAAGQRKGRPIVIAMRAPDSVGYCRAVGIDLERWFTEKLVDIWIGAGYFRLNPWAVSAEFAHRHGIKFYASLDETRIPRAAKKRNLPILPGRMSPAHYAARFADAIASGCDGVYVFNIEGAFMHRICSVDPKDTAGLEKVRFATGRGSGGYRPWMYLKDGGRFCNLPRIDPGEPRTVSPGETCRFDVFVGDDLAAAKSPKITADVLTNLNGGEKIAFACNGRIIEPVAEKAGRFTYRLTADSLKKGDNSFAVTFPKNVPPKATFNDFSLRIVP